jgi:hypothetical protein
MRFAVVPMRSRGRPLPRGELANLPPWIGDLRIEEIRDEQLMRYVRTARVLLLDRPRAACVLGELLEPQIIAMSPQAFTLSGYERIDERCYAQSWLVRPATDAWTLVGPGRGMQPVQRIDRPE